MPVGSVALLIIPNFDLWILVVSPHMVAGLGYCRKLG